MRHVLVIGKYGQFPGALLEVAQYFRADTRKSALDPQDFYSNAVGERFYILYSQHLKANPTKFAFYFKEYLKNNRYRYAPTKHVYKEINTQRF